MEIAAPSDGIHLTWQYCQNTKIAQEELSVPFCALVELLAPVEGMHVLQYPPSLCGSCKSALNCYCEVDYDRQQWRCPICGTIQQLPGHYRGITEQHLPAELFAGCNVVEHELPATSQPIKPPIVLFLLDMCIAEEDMASMKQTIERALSSLPESTRIGIITFGSMVYLHNLTSSTIATCTVYRGTTGEPLLSAPITKRDIGVKSRHSQSRAAIGGPGAAGANDTPFIVPLSECDFAVDRVLEGMIPEASKPCMLLSLCFSALAVSTAGKVSGPLRHVPWLHGSSHLYHMLSSRLQHQGERHKRCTGAALAVAVSLLETAAYTESGRIMLLSGGPATVGPGAIVSVDYAEPLRTHKDLDKGSAKHFSASATFYDGLAHRLIENGQALDVFACALDQTGVAEMEHLAICTGGLLTQAEHFGHNVFQNSFMSLLQPSAVPSGAEGASLDEVLPWALNGMLEVSPAKNLGVSGAVGPIASLEKKSAAAVEPQIGLGATTAWKLNAISDSTSVAFFFRPTSKDKAKAPAGGSPLVFQTRLTYQHPSGVRRMRIATKATYWADSGTNPQGMGFSANTSAIVFARWLAYEASRGASARELSTWLDRQLVSLTQRSASFKEGDTDSVVLPGELSSFPELVFHIRRSTFLNYFGNAPDETVFYRSLLFREGHESCALMLRPRLLSFNVDGSGPQELPLDIAAIPVDAVAVLDSWYTVIVHTGSHLASWVKQGLLEDPEYEHVKEGYEQAHEYANHLVASRLPQPRLVVCDQGTSQARFLLARLNPSQTQQNTDGQDVGAVIFTDDVSFDVFMEQLRKLIVGKNS